jgi:hypothetical protein
VTRSLRTSLAAQTETGTQVPFWTVFLMPELNPVFMFDDEEPPSPPWIVPGICVILVILSRYRKNLPFGRDKSAALR